MLFNRLFSYIKQMIIRVVFQLLNPFFSTCVGVSRVSNEISNGTALVEKQILHNDIPIPNALVHI